MCISFVNDEIENPSNYLAVIEIDLRCKLPIHAAHILICDINYSNHLIQYCVN